MLDSLLTLTKGGAFWLAVFFVASTITHFFVSALMGAPEPLFALFALASLGALLVSGMYTLAKSVIRKWVSSR